MTEGIIIAIITVCGSLAVAIVTSRSQNKQVLEKMADIKKDQDKMHLGILRLTVMSEEMPISERIAAGQEYIDKDGNGEVKHFYQDLLAEHIK